MPTNHFMRYAIVIKYADGFVYEDAIDASSVTKVWEYANRMHWLEPEYVGSGEVREIIISAL